MIRPNRYKILWVIGALLFLALFNFSYYRNTKPVREVDYSLFIADVNEGRVASVLIQGDIVEGVYKDKTRFRTHVPSKTFTMVDRLLDKNVVIRSMAYEPSVGFWGVFFSLLPLLIMIGMWLFFVRQMNTGPANRMMGFLSKVKKFEKTKDAVKFTDVAGAHDAKESLEEIVSFLKDPKPFEKLGGRVPKGVLLDGPPGTGKTLLARAVAGESHSNFFSISATEFIEMFVGVGASRVRTMFEQARQNAPCIIFIDEIDAIGRHRGSGGSGANDEREQTLNQMLVEMDGFVPTDRVVVIAATNRKDVLDSALLRPGRFDRHITVSLPDLKERYEILRVHAKKTLLDKDVDLMTIARGTPGCSGADLAGIVNEAAIRAARLKRTKVLMRDFEYAKDKMLMGAERKSLTMKDEEKALTAYHEAGHALVAYYTPHTDPIYKATITPRGRALGMVMHLPEDDSLSLSKIAVEANMCVALGGRAAEEIIRGDAYITTGASSDFQYVYSLARNYVSRWGMSRLGILSFQEPHEYYAQPVSKASEAMAQKIEETIAEIVQRFYKNVVDLLTERRPALEALAQALLKFETLNGSQIKRVVDTLSYEFLEEEFRTLEEAPVATNKGGGKGSGKNKKQQKTIDETPSATENPTETSSIA